MKTDRLSRRRAVGLMTLGGVAASALAPRRARAQPLDKISYQTDWRAQAEHGGFYQASPTGIYKEHGLEVEIRQGGPQVNVNAQLLAGRADFIGSNSFAALNFARETCQGVPSRRCSRRTRGC